MAWNTETILIVFVAFTGLAVLMQACVLLGIFFSLRKAASSVLEVTEDLKETVIPMVHSTRQLVERISPEVITVTGALAELTNTVRKETAGVHISASEVISRVTRQVQRMDAMLTVILDRLEKAGGTLESTVAGPVRQANGILAAIKATIEAYRSYPTRPKSSGFVAGDDPGI